MVATLHSPYVRVVKPVIDRIGAILFLLILSPLLLAVAAAVRVSLGPGVIYRQVRIGRSGEPFEILKFRTMAPDRRRAARSIAGTDRRHTHKSPDDPRHTRLGQFLRRYSIDELPQLWNVVRGDLSLVGPRPELLQVVEQHYEKWQHDRHLVRPGLTGLWQVTQREDHGEMYRHVEIDLHYIKQLSLGMDLKILIRTVPVLLRIPTGDWFGLSSAAIEAEAVHTRFRPEGAPQASYGYDKPSEIAV